ncbi:FtsQ-type POTRA domain-containing protein [uncultured Sneathia sp.]|uniref:cell division protein FtsQ/DivIB n=1 Tax=uncultured Sneathia sp. TaxID=278067 RepID=UPI0025920676|nr:FtsQ-type POTRA domain-containing protein [uncultured Sneathia sp.]
MKERIKKDVLLLILFLIIIGILQMVQSDFFYVDEIQVEGNNEILKKDIISKLDEFKNKPIVYVNTNLLVSNISSDARVKEVIIKKSYPNKLKVYIEERKPLAYVMNNDKLFAVDENLNIFTSYDELDNKGLPIVYYNNKDEENDISMIVKSLSKSSLYPLSSEIYKQDDKYIIVLSDGVKVYVKKDVSIKKLNQGYIVYNKEKEQNNSMEYIDLRFELISVR